MHKFSHGTTGSPDTIRGMSVEMLFDFMAVRLDSAKAAGKNISLNFNMSNGDNLNLTLNDSVLNYRKTLQPQADASFYISREDLHAVLTGQAKMADLVKAKKAKIIGNGAKLDEYRNPKLMSLAFGGAEAPKSIYFKNIYSQLINKIYKL